MPEDLPDLGHRRTGTEHAGGQAVPQEVRAVRRRFQPGFTYSPADDCVDRPLLAQLSNGCPGPDENPTGRALWPVLT